MSHRDCRSAREPVTVTAAVHAVLPRMRGRYGRHASVIIEPQGRRPFQAYNPETCYLNVGLKAR
jgi:hypothetical protein